MCIFVSNEIIRSSMSNESFSVYCAISSLSKINSDVTMFSIDMISYVMYGKINMPRSQKDVISKSINELVLCGAIEVLDSSNNTYVIRNVFKVDKSFTMIDDYDIQTIMLYDEGKTGKRLNKHSIFRYYMGMCMTINQDKKSGWWSIEELSDVCGIDKDTTAIKYNDILEGLKLIYIHRNNVTITYSDGGSMRARNTYGKYEDKIFIKDCAEQYIGALQSCNGKKVNDDVFDSRRVSALYNSFVNGTYRGSVENLKDMCLLYNAKYKNVPESKLKDMSVFDGGESLDDCMDELFDDDMIWGEKPAIIYQHTNVKVGK